MNVQWTIKHTIVKTNLFGFGTYFAPYVFILMIKCKLKTKVPPLTEALLA